MPITFKIHENYNLYIKKKPLDNKYRRFLHKVSSEFLFIKDKSTQIINYHNKTALDKFTFI